MVSAASCAAFCPKDEVCCSFGNQPNNIGLVLELLQIIVLQLDEVLPFLKPVAVVFKVDAQIFLCASVKFSELLRSANALPLVADNGRGDGANGNSVGHAFACGRCC